MSKRMKEHADKAGYYIDEFTALDEQNRLQWVRNFLEND